MSAFILGFLVLISCQAISHQPDAYSARPLTEILTLELALQRDQQAVVNSTVNELLKAPLTDEVFQHVYRLLRHSKYHSIREKLVSTWTEQHPDSQGAYLADVYVSVCNDPISSKQKLVTVLANDESLILERFMRCLDETQRGQILQLLFNERSEDARVQSAYINNLIENKQQEQALADIASIDLADRSSEILKLQGRLQRETRQTSAAMSTYLTLAARQPLDMEVNLALAEMYYDQQNFQETLNKLAIVIRQMPTNRQAQYLNAASYYALNNLVESEFWFMKLLTANNYRNRAFYYLGQIAQQQSKINTAIEYYSKVRPSDLFLSAQLQLWRIIAKEQPELAALGLEQLAKEFPQDRLAINLAEIELLSESGENHRALQQLINLADDYPNNLRLQLLRLRWLVEQDHVSRVTQNTLASLSGLKEPDNQFQLLESAVFYLISQQIGVPAIEILDSQNLVPRNNSRYVFLEGVANAIGGNYKRAIQGLEQLVLLAPDNPAYLNALGYTLTLAGEESSDAKKYIEKALEIDPENPAYLDSLAWFHYKQGDNNKAITLLRRALKNSQSASIYGHLVEILLHQGEHEKAAEVLTKAAGLFPRNRVISMLQSRLEK